MSEYIFKWLESALDFGFTEQEFWDMTLAELLRSIESKRRVKKIHDQEKASFDYILADLIGKSVSRIYSSANAMPEISEVYPTLFDGKEIQEKKRERQVELSALRFKLFAKSYNDNFKNKEGAKVKNE